jgi:SARP family transcriptional regulator, regulator of embCAB operon
MSSASAVEFAVLGPLQASVGDAVLPMGTPQQRAVLALLIVDRNRAVGADAIIDAVWGERAPDTARATLQTYISIWRSRIGSAGLDARAVLATAPPGYRLAVGDHECDVARFSARRRAGVHAAAAAQFEEASRHLSAALAEWRGPVLDDLRDFGFVEPIAKALDDEKVDSHIAYAEAEIACGRAQAVVTDLERLTTEHLYREPLWAQLITAYYLAGRQSDALDAYSRLKSTMADDLGLDPSPALRALQERILRQQPLDVRGAAQSSAEDTIMAVEPGATRVRRTIAAALRDANGQRHPLAGTATLIGRSPDNHVVLPGTKVSRHHAVITDNGTTFVVTDLGSANGVMVGGQKIHLSAEVSDGDCIRIAEHELTLEANPSS